jgi:acyl carrier protein
MVQVLNHSWNGKDVEPPSQMGDPAVDPATAPGGSPDAGAIATWLRTRLAERLGLFPDEIDIDEEFANYGLNSIEAVNLSGDLENFLGRRLPPTLLWDYPTIGAIADYLAEDTSPDAVAADGSPSPSPEEAQRLLGELDQMSDAEVDALLNSMLSEEERH